MSPRTMHRRSRNCTAVAVLLLASCSSQPAKERYADLLELFPFTLAGQQVTMIEFATPQAAAYLGKGWSAPGTLPEGEAVVWLKERKATLEFELTEPADRVMILRCAASPERPSRGQVVSVRLNRRPVRRLVLEGRMAEYRIELPARLQRAGNNRLEFLGGPGRNSPRQTGVAVASLRHTQSGALPNRTARVEGLELQVPTSVTVSYFLRIPEHGELTFGVDNATDSQLLVSVQPDGAAESMLYRGAVSSASVRVPLDRYEGKVVRIGFQAVGDGGIVRVRQPQLLGKARPKHRPPNNAKRRSVLLYVIDTLRADHLGCYGYARPTSPHIDALAREGLLFESMIAQSSWTRPATASILTGVYPPRHGAQTLRDRLAPEVATMAELFRQQGYRTAAFVTNINVAGRWGFRRGFDRYAYLQEDEESLKVHVRADEVNRQALSWLRERNGQPFFLYLHVTDPHAPYTPLDSEERRFCGDAPSMSAEDLRSLFTALRDGTREATSDEVRALVCRYDAEIAQTDSSFGRLLTELRRLGRYEDTAVVVVSDHGEEFLDHGGVEHGRTLYREQLRVPLVMRLPSMPEGRKVSVTARQIDLLPTLLEYVGIPVPEGLDGRSLLPYVGGRASTSEEVFAASGVGTRKLRALIGAGWKVIDAEGRRGDHVRMFDLDSDPGEREDVAMKRPILVQYAIQALGVWYARGTASRREDAREVPVDAATIERLRALGYLDSEIEAAQ